MKTNFYLKFLSLIISVLALVSCSDDDPVPVTNSDFPIGENGYFILNEGGWGNGDASLSYYNRDSAKIFNNIFETYAGRPLGDQAQSMCLIDSLGFIVVQTSVKIEVIHAYKFNSVATITEDDGLISPREILQVSDDKAYITDWGSNGVNGTVHVLNLNTYETTKAIATGQGADKMIKRGDKVYVINQGGWGEDNTVAVIDIASDELLKKIEVKANPNSIQLDQDNNIWVAGSGSIVYDAEYNQISTGFLARVGEDDEVDFIWEATEDSGSISNLIINDEGDELYYSHAGAVYNLPINASALASSSIITGSFYDLGFDPVNGQILGAYAPNFTAAGTAFIYTTEGEELKNFTTGIGPNSFVFRNN